MKDEDKVYPRWLIRRTKEKYFLSATPDGQTPKWEIVFLRWPLSAGYTGYASKYYLSFDEACAAYAQEADSRKAGRIATR